MKLYFTKPIRVCLPCLNNIILCFTSNSLSSLQKVLLYTFFILPFFFYTTKSHSAETNLEESLVQALQNEWVQTNQSNIFFEFFQAKNWEEALYHWDDAFSTSAFNKSPTGRALYAYLLFKNRIRIMGIETLFQIPNPEDILKEMQLLWQSTVSHRNRIWKFVDIKWSPEWTQVFDMRTELVVLLSKTFSIEDIELMDMQFRDVASQMPSWLHWRVIIALAARQRFNGATVRLKNLLKRKNPPVSPSLIYLTLGRVYFQEKVYDEAILYYEKIPRKSDYWLIAQEEIAWSYLLKEQPQEALGYTQTLIHPVLANQVGPEPSYLHALASLKVCDYAEAIKTLRDFKTRFELRIKALRSLRQKGRTAAARHLRRQFFRLKKTPLNLLDIGPQARRLPFLVYKDEFLFDLLKNERRLLIERRHLNRLIESANQPKKDSKNISKTDILQNRLGVYSQTFFKDLSQKITEKLRNYNRQFYIRLRELASRDLKEFDKVVQKLQVVEAEVLQFVTLKLPSEEAEKAYLKRKLKQKSLAPNYEDAQKLHKLVFVDKHKELWFDELGYYRVQVDKCL